ncbi:MAG: 50S ribosomal protein L22 [Dehalococcoidia bacterium]|nr:50S ribosomal protein L22 [Dehalococcoidia bacterium]MDW8119306.1 50S ribosomal protein L22 [Chloroflexota bacterium]
MPVRAVIKNYGQSPKKVRRVLGLIRGKKVGEAEAILRYIPSPSARAVLKALQSALANAEHNHMLAADDLRIVAAYADDGPRLKRARPQARGRINPILKRTCHITIVVDEEATGGP